MRSNVIISRILGKEGIVRLSFLKSCFSVISRNSSMIAKDWLSSHELELTLTPSTIFTDKQLSFGIGGVAKDVE